MLQRMLLCWISIALTVSALAQQPGREPAKAEQRAAQAITESALRAHIRFLADDLLEGRGPGTRGDRLAQRYIATQFESLGLKPAAPEGGWFQPVPLLGINTHTPERIAFRKGLPPVSASRERRRRLEIPLRPARRPTPVARR